MDNKDTPRPVKAPRSPCFTSGTIVATNNGPVQIENLSVGDKVLTRDNGYRSILWIGVRHFDAVELGHYRELQPIRIAAGALGPQTPSRNMRVSPHHRMLLTGDMAMAWANESEILVPAMDLTFLPGVTQVTQGNVTYVHLMFAEHEVVRADGCWTESFLPEAEILDQMNTAQRNEILTIFPELASNSGILAYEPARFCTVTQLQAPTMAALAA